MNILIPHSWLRDFLKTKASVRQIADCLSLAGPSVERVHKVGKDSVYDLEVTSNRVDLMSVYGIAREAAAILPQFGYKAKLIKPNLKKLKVKTKLDFKIQNDPSLCFRILAVKLSDIKLARSPQWMQDRLTKVGIRPLGNAIDITNYVMWETGHPLHAFDFDRLTTKTIHVREAKKNEKLTTLDNKTYTLHGGEVVFDNGQGEIIDLPGIMGTANSVITKDTRNVLLWIESVDPKKIRQASMTHGIRTQAAVLNEKSVDPELGFVAILRAIELFLEITTGKIASELVDIYPKKSSAKKIHTDIKFIETKLGISLKKEEVKKILERLDLTTAWQGNKFLVRIPSFRANDIKLPEDIVEEVARIYGYFKLPSKLMATALPDHNNDKFDFEKRVKEIAVRHGGYEVYTLSFAERKDVSKGAIEIKNPLGEDTRFMRTSLRPSLASAIDVNMNEKESFWLFEMANVYLPVSTNSLPNEKMMFAGIMKNFDYREAKGIVESILESLNIEYQFKLGLAKGFVGNSLLEIRVKNKLLGTIGLLNDDKGVYFEFSMEELEKCAVQVSSYSLENKYPAQIEDLTFVLPEKTLSGSVFEKVIKIDNRISRTELVSVHENAHTYRVWYQDPKKTLTDNEVKNLREKIISSLQSEFGVEFKG